MGNKQTMDEDTKNLFDSLKKLRDKGKNDRESCRKTVLEYLNYKKIDATKMFQFDAFLIKAVDIRFGESQEADIVLMAFGLLRGYEYEEIAITDRRRKYLAESNLEYNPRSKIKSFVGVNSEEEKKTVEALRKREDKRIEWLANFLLGQSNIGQFINEIDDYIENIGGVKFARLPEPSYLKNNLRVQNKPASGKDAENMLDEEDISYISPDDGPEGSQPEFENRIPAEGGTSDDTILPSKADDGNRKTSQKIRMLILEMLGSHLSKILLLILSSGITIVCVILALTVYNYSCSEGTVFSGNVSVKEHEALEVDSIEILNKNIYLAPGTDAYLEMNINPDSVQREELDYISSDRTVVTTEKHHIIAHSWWQEDAEHNIVITVQGGLMAEDKVYVTVINPDRTDIQHGAKGDGASEDDSSGLPN